MMTAEEIELFLGYFPPSTLFAIDEGGLSLVAVSEDGRPTGEYLEVGGAPLDQEDADDGKLPEGLNSK